MAPSAPLSLANRTLAMVVSVLLPAQPKKIGMPGVFIFAVSTMICFFSSGDSIDDSPVEPMIRMAAEPLSSWNFKSVRKAGKSTEPSLLNGVIRATNEPASVFDIFVSIREFDPAYHGSADQPAAIARRISDRLDRDVDGDGALTSGSHNDRIEVKRAEISG